MNTKEWKELFVQVNSDCLESGELVVPFTDTEFYAEQIQCIDDTLTEEQALSIANSLTQE